MEQWSKLQLDSGVYIMKVHQNEGAALSCWLSDFKVLWNESFATNEQILQRIGDQNPDLIIDGIEERLFETLRNIDMACNTKISATNDGDLMLEATYFMEGGLSIKFHWSLKQCGTESFFNQITKHLVYQIGELEHHNKQLVDTVKSKDNEIQQYKLETGITQLARKAMITETFDQTKCMPPRKLFKCEIDEFEDVIGTLSKNVVNEEAVVSAVVPKSSPRAVRQRNRTQFQKIVRLGVSYNNSDDDDEDGNKDGPVQATPAPSNAQKSIEIDKAAEDESAKAKTVKISPTKRIRRSFNL